MRTFIVSHYYRVRALYEKYERLLMPITLVGGFLLDYVTFTNIQINLTLTLLSVYWVFAGVVIAFTHLYDANMLHRWFQFKYFRLFSPLLIQFAFGSLLGSSLIFYWFAGALSVSWPVLIVIALLLIFNETFRDYFEKPVVHIGVYFFATVSLLSLLLPFVFNSLSIWMFLLAALISVGIFSLYIHYLCRFASHLQPQKYLLFAIVVAITIAMNVLYFTNIIPPIPLALREAGMYHSITVSQNQYVMKGEQENFWKKALFGQTVHALSGEKIYLYSAIFAPAKISTSIVHHWQHYDEQQKDWVSYSKLSFIINGGRKEGYKGYSWQSNLAQGRWRVYVENPRGQVLGIVRFTVEQVNEPAILQETLR